MSRAQVHVDSHVHESDKQEINVNLLTMPKMYRVLVGKLLDEGWARAGQHENTASAANAVVQHARTTDTAPVKVKASIPIVYFPYNAFHYIYIY